jgi:DNA-binding transcriptional regulator LsrR (DeoR family)
MADAKARNSADLDKGNRRQQRNRLRIAWMYYVEGLTQNEISDRLGLGRVTVIRNIQEARRRNEVRISINGEDADCVELEFKLQEAFALREAVVVPSPTQANRIAAAVGAATGSFISERLRNGMSIGVGWGDTLMEALPTLAASDFEGMEVVSLLGGVAQAKRHNPSEFAWQVAQAINADCYLLAAPAIVDSGETRRILFERCGLDDVLRRAERLDMAVMSAGALNNQSTTFRFGYYSDQDRADLMRLGAVGDVLCHFFDKQGRLLDHPLNSRVMSVPIARVQSVPERVIASGGMEKIDAMLGAIRLMRPTVLITDEDSARELLLRSSGPQS